MHQSKLEHGERAHYLREQNNSSSLWEKPGPSLGWSRVKVVPGEEQWLLEQRPCSVRT